MKLNLTLIFVLFFSAVVWAQSILTDKSSFAVTRAVIYVDPSEPELVKTAATLLQQDIQQVTGKTIPIVTDINQAGKNVIAIGTLGQSPFLKQLASQKRLNTTAIDGKWEASLLQTIRKPVQGIAQALIIAGSDRRGAAYGVFELSKQLGVSPWYWWADVPVQQRKEICIKSDVSLADAPESKIPGLIYQ